MAVEIGARLVTLVLNGRVAIICKPHNWNHTNGTNINILLTFLSEICMPLGDLLGFWLLNLDTFYFGNKNDYLKPA